MSDERAIEAAVRSFFDGLEDGMARKIIGRFAVVGDERDGAMRVCMATPELRALPAALLDGAEASGLPIGTLDDGAFRLDLQGAVLAAPHTRSQTVRVSEKASQLFLYGRNVLGDSVEWHDADLAKGDACIVCNPRGEALGLGRVVGSFKGTRAAVAPLHDLGAYLREQGGRDQSE